MYVRLSKKIVTGTTNGQILQEIAKICTGAITDKSQLVAFDPATSEIISGTPTNWELIYPLIFTASTNVYVLRSQCVNTAKYKYVRFLIKSTADLFAEPTGAVSNPYSKVFSSTTFYLEMNSCSAVNSSTGALTNSTYYHYNNEGIVIGSSDIYLSFGPRHMLVYGDSIGINVFGVFEFPENTVTTGKNLIPSIAYRGRGGALTASTTSRDTAASSSNSIAQIPDGYNATTSASNILLSADSASTGLSNFDFNAQTIGSAYNYDRFNLASPIRKIITKDLIVYDALRSHSFMNASVLSDVTFLPNDVDAAPLGMTYTKSSNTYVSLPLNNGTATLIVPKK